MRTARVYRFFKYFCFIKLLIGKNPKFFYSLLKGLNFVLAVKFAFRLRRVRFCKLLSPVLYKYFLYYNKFKRFIWVLKIVRFFKSAKGKKWVRRFKSPVVYLLRKVLRKIECLSKENLLKLSSLSVCSL